MNNVSFSTNPKNNRKTPSIEEMAEIVIWEVGHHFKMNMDSWWFRLLRKMMLVPAQKFAQVMYDFDRTVAEKSLWQATREILPKFTKPWHINGAKNIPKEGPLLAISNHPGAADSLSAMGIIERPDVHFLVIKRPMLTVMPNVSRHMFYLEEHNPVRFNVIRNLVKVLQKGETILMFPRGNLEPDPMLYTGALDSVEKWSDSPGIFLSQAPETKLQLILVQNVVLTRAWQSFIARLGKTHKTRHQIAMILQTAMQQLFESWKIPPVINLPKPISARELAPSLNPHALSQALKAYAKEEMARIFPKH